MIKITLDKDIEICKCGHSRKDHSYWRTECYRVTHRKERRRNPKTNKYEVYQTHYQCTCRGFEPREAVK